MIKNNELWPDISSTADHLNAQLIQLEQTRRATLPCLHPSLSQDVVIRWFWRAFLARQNQWCPLLIHSAELNSIEHPWPFAMRFVSADANIPQDSDDLWVTISPESFEVSAQWSSRALAVDAWHGVAADPDLATVRSNLLVACKNGGPIHIKAERTSGARDLIYWAHAMLDDQPISDLSYDAPPIPGQWLVVPRLDELTQTQQESLHHVLARHREPPRVHRDDRTSERPSHPALSPLIGQSKVYTQTLHMLTRLAQSDLTMLLLGEPGVGKGLVAKAAHDMSGRTGQFITLDVGTLTPSLVESALFGHIKGAFTGAAKARQGAFRQAHKGTLFLDEVGNLEPELQVKFLRALQERQVLPVGADQPVDVDVRVIAASNSDLDAMVRQGSFRLDLLGRLNAATLHVPALRDRGQDFELIARHLLNIEHPSDPWCTNAARALLQAYHWPGNVREFINTIRYAQVMSANTSIAPEHLGALAPQNNRRVPLLMVNDTAREGETFHRHAPPAHLLSSMSIHVPPLRERNVASRLHHLLLKLPENRCTALALRALSRHNWWGNHAAMDAIITRLLADDTHPISLARLNILCPEVVKADYLGPLILILNPVVRRQDSIDGFRQSFREPTLLLGRIANISELRTMAQYGDAKAQQWLDDIQQDAIAPVCVPLHLSRISRAHVLVRRKSDTLHIARLPHTVMGVQLRTAEHWGLQTIGPGQEVFAGTWAELHFCDRHGNTQMSLLLCCDAHAEEDYLSHLNTISQPQTNTDAIAPLTLMETATPQRKRVSMWTLNTVEVDIFVDMISSYQSGSFKRHMETMARTYLTHQGARQICTFIHHVPRLSQYLVRLIQHETNTNLRTSLLERFEHSAQLHAKVSLFPKSLQPFLHVE